MIKPHLSLLPLTLLPRCRNGQSPSRIWFSVMFSTTGVDGRGGGEGAASRLGTRKERQARALLRNAGGPRGWRSVVKRIAGGSAERLRS